MEVLLGLTGKDFTIIAASKAAVRGPTVLKAQDDKTRHLSEHTVMAVSGEAGDVLFFPEYIQANVALYASRNNYTLPPQSIASFVRSELARSLRSGPYYVNLLIGGVDTTAPSAAIPPAADTNTSPVTSSPSSGPTTTAPAVITPASSETESLPGEKRAAVPKLYWMDYLASCAQVPYAAHGYAQYYCLSILDKHHHPDIDLDTGLKLLRMCSDELKRRLPIDFKGLLVKVITVDGVRVVDFQDDVSIKAA